MKAYFISYVCFLFSVTIALSLDYFPCQSWISFSYDDSSTLQNIDFKTQLSFISSAIGSINYPDRLRVDAAYTQVASWNSHQTTTQIQNLLNSTEQTANSYSLLQQFASLVNSLEVLTNSNNWPIGALIFISDTSDRALRNAIRLFPQLNSVRLTFVLLGPNADSSKLTNFSSNFITWRDLSQPMPDNWNTLYPSAYGCGNITITTPATIGTSESTTTLSTLTSTTSSLTSTLTTSSSTPINSLTTTTLSSPSSSTTTVQSSSTTTTATTTLPSTTYSTSTSTSSTITASTEAPIYPRKAEIIFILDDSNCGLSSGIQDQENTVSKILANYSLGVDEIKVANPRSIGSSAFNYLFFTSLKMFKVNLLDCNYPKNKSFAIDKAIRSSMSFAYKYSRNTSEALVFVVFTENNGTWLQDGDNGAAFNASILYRNKCMRPGNVGIIQINPGYANVNTELGDYFFNYDDPNLINKFTNAILAMNLFNKSAIPNTNNECIDPIISY